MDSTSLDRDFRHFLEPEDRGVGGGDDISDSLHDDTEDDGSCDEDGRDDAADVTWSGGSMLDVLQKKIYTIGII